MVKPLFSVTVNASSAAVNGVIAAVTVTVTIAVAASPVVSVIV